MKFVGLVLNWYIVNIFNDKMILFLNFYLFQVQIKLSFVLYPTLEALEFFPAFSWQNYVCTYTHRHATHTAWQFNTFSLSTLYLKIILFRRFPDTWFYLQVFYPAFLPFAPCPILLSMPEEHLVYSFSMLALSSLCWSVQFSDSALVGGGSYKAEVRFYRKLLCSRLKWSLYIQIKVL